MPESAITIPGIGDQNPGITDHDRPEWVITMLRNTQDIALTRRLVAAGSLLGIEILDHLVLGEAGRFTSLRERGVL